jgi:hypothetical protein
MIFRVTDMERLVHVPYEMAKETQGFRLPSLFAIAIGGAREILRIALNRHEHTIQGRTITCYHECGRRLGHVDKVIFIGAEMGVIPCIIGPVTRGVAVFLHNPW